MTGRAPTPALADRVRAALKREREAGAPVIARGLGVAHHVVLRHLRAGVAAGWARFDRMDGAMHVFAFVDAAGGKA